MQKAGRDLDEIGLDATERREMARPIMRAVSGDRELSLETVDREQRSSEIALSGGQLDAGAG